MSRNLSSTELKRLHREWRQRTTGRVALALDGVQTPYNVGSILRMAAAYRVDHLWLADPTAPVRHAKTAKTSLGSERFLSWTEVETGTDAVEAARADGYRVVGIELAAGAVPLPDLDLGGDICLVLGHEDRGLAAPTTDACDDVAFIPQLGKIGSLNVASAAAIALYETRRHNWH